MESDRKFSPGSTSDGFHGYWPMDFEKVDPHLNNLAVRTTLFDLLDEGNFTNYQDGLLNIFLKAKEARIYRLID